MRNVLRMVMVVGLLLPPTMSRAQATPTFDDGFVVINLNNEVTSQSGKKPAKVNYSPAMRLRVFGAEKGDALKVKWLKGKKTLVERRCVLSIGGRGDGRLGLSDRCWGRDAKITAHGNLTVEVRFVDDSEEKETLLRTMKVPVARYWRVDRILKGKAVHSPRYQVVGSDLMGMAYAWLRPPSNTDAFGNVYFYFWATLAKDNSNYPDPSWRCKLGGKSVPEMNVDGHRALESISSIKQQDDQMKGKKRLSSWYGWRLMWIKPNLIWGKKRNPTAPSTVGNSRYNISQHPGKYVCRLRDAGETVREFSFTVADSGLLTPHGAQAPGGVSLSPGAYFIDIKIVPNKAEHSFDAKAAKKSVAFGRPWLKAADVKALLGRFPKSFGSAVPKKPRGAR